MALTMTMLTPWNLPHGQWSKKLTMNDHDTLDFVHGQWSKLTNFDHLTTVILKFWLWSWSKIFDHLTGVGQMVKELWSSYPPPSLFRRLVSSNHSQPRPMAWRRYILPDPAKKRISGQYSTHYILLLRYWHRFVTYKFTWKFACLFAALFTYLCIPPPHLMPSLMAFSGYNCTRIKSCSQRERSMLQSILLL